MTLRRRVEQLEKAKLPPDGPCPACAASVIVMRGEPVPTCEQCGRLPARVVEVVEVIVDGSGGESCAG